MQLKSGTAVWAAVLVAALFISGVVALWALDYSQRRDLAVSRAHERALSASYALSRQINSVLLDLTYLAQGEAFLHLRQGATGYRRELQEHWENYLSEHQYLQQIRYLNNNGQERVRVQRNAEGIEAIAEESLQDKSGRYYFIDAIGLVPGQIYLSEIDLNIEHGVIEVPFRPMFRLALRLSAAGGGTSDGLLILNVDAEYLLSPLMPEARRRSELVLADSDGRSIIDREGNTFWDLGQRLPVTQLSTPFLEGMEGAESYTDISDGQVVTGIKLSSLLQTRQSELFLQPLVAPTMPWYILVKYPLPLLPASHSRLQVFLSALTVLALMALCYLLTRRSFQLEKALRQSQTLKRCYQDQAAENQSMIAQLGEGVLLFDHDQQLIRVNEPARRMLALRSEVELGYTAQRLLPEVCRYGHLKAGVGELLIESNPPVLLQASVSHLVVGSEPRHMVVLSELGRIQGGERSAGLLHSVLDVAEARFLLVDASLRVEYVNNSARRLFATQGTLLGARLDDLGLCQPEALRETLSGLKRDGLCAEVRVEVKEEGQVRPVNLMASRLGSFKGADYYLLRLIDITDDIETGDDPGDIDKGDMLGVMPNRVELARAFEAKARDSRSLALMIMDIDRLRMINNSLGYRAGDRVIRYFSRKLNDAASGSLVSRLSADSFVVVCDGDEDAVLKLLEEVRSRMAAPIQLGSQNVKVTFSVGVAYWPNHAAKFDMLLQAAMVALNTTKGMRGQVSVFEPSFAESDRRLLALEEYLKRSIEEERFELYYQPVVNAKTGSIEQFEALLRLRDEEGNPLSPDSFVPLLEESGWILLLEPWLLRKAANAAAILARRMPGGAAVAVNICGSELLEAGFVERVVRILNDAKCEPNWITLEVTERQFMEQPQKVIEVLQALREMGIRVAVDDFGTGYSSLTYIKRLPVEHLKIDREFIRGLPGSVQDDAIVRSVSRMADGLGMSIIAEGVETEEQMQWLYKHKIYLYQGFRFARPAPLETWLSPAAIREVLGPLEQLAGKPKRETVAKVP